MAGRAADLVHQLYRGHRDRFVREYAATSPEEDIAETYSAWALGRTRDLRRPGRQVRASSTSTRSSAR